VPRFLRPAGIAAAVLVLLSDPLAAQKLFTIWVGPSMAHLSGDSPSPYSNYETRTAVNVELSLAGPLTHGLGIRVGAAYAQKGSTTDGGRTTIALDYIEFPVLLQIGPQTHGPNLVVGPAFSFRSKCEARLTLSTGHHIKVPCTQYDIEAKGADLGMVGGLQITSSASRRLRVVVDALYELGFVSINRLGRNNRNRAFTIRVGLGLGGNR